MLEGYKTAKTRWAGASDIVDRWLNERQALIILYCSINGMDSLDNDKRSVFSKLKELCQLLVDYVSAGHFEVYERLLQEGFELDHNGINPAKSLYLNIERNTRACLAFNDKCERISTIKGLQQALSHLGETLEERFTLEDNLLETLQITHQTAAST